MGDHISIIMILTTIAVNVAVLLVGGWSFYIGWICRAIVWWFVAFIGYGILGTVINSIAHGNVKLFAMEILTALLTVVAARRWYKAVRETFKNLPGWASIRRAERRHVPVSYNTLGPP